MAAYLTPILEQVETILQANLNTEKDAIDNGLTDTDNDSIKIEDFGLQPPRFPWVQIFPFGEAEIIDEQNVNAIIRFPVVTAITINSSTSTQGIKDLDTWITAIIKTIISGTTSTWDADGTTDRIWLQSISFQNFLGEDESEIFKTGFISWLMEIEVDPTA